MIGWQRKHREIKELIGQTGKRVLLVEGSDDAFALRILLSRRSESDWEMRWTLAKAGSKKNVTDILLHEPNWFGIVDRDEWSIDISTQMQDELNNLFILPRFCLESYAIDPVELWQALPQKMQKKMPDGFETFEGEILRNKDRWLRHGVLWTEINPLWSGLRALGFKEKLLDFEAAQNDDRIVETLKEWHGYLDPDSIFQNFQKKLYHVSELPTVDQLQKWVHGKRFFLDHVHSVLNRYFGQSDAQTWMKKIFTTCVPPDDLEPLWSRIEPD